MLFATDAALIEKYKYIYYLVAKKEKERKEIDSIIINLTELLCITFIKNIINFYSVCNKVIFYLYKQQTFIT